MVAPYTVNILSSAGALKSAIEAVAVNVPIQVFPYEETGQQKFILVIGAAGAPA